MAYFFELITKQKKRQMNKTQFAGPPAWLTCLINWIKSAVVKKKGSDKLNVLSNFIHHLWLNRIIVIWKDIRPLEAAKLDKLVKTPIFRTFFHTIRLILLKLCYLPRPLLLLHKHQFYLLKYAIADELKQPNLREWPWTSFWGSFFRISMLMVNKSWHSPPTFLPFWPFLCLIMLIMHELWLLGSKIYY